MATLAELRTRARDRADMADSEFVVDAELNRYINASAAELYDILVSAYEDYYTTSTTFTLTSGQSTFALPSNFYKLKGVDYANSGSTDYVTVKQYSFRERNALLTSNFRIYTGNAPVLYRVLAKNLQLLPEGNGAGDYRLWYIPSMPALVSDTDEFDGVNGWEEFIVLDVAIKMLAKEESDPAILLMDRERIRMRIMEMARDRDAGEPERVSDVHRDESIFGEFNGS